MEALRLRKSVAQLVKNINFNEQKLTAFFIKPAPAPVHVEKLRTLSQLIYAVREWGFVGNGLLLLRKGSHLLMAQRDEVEFRSKLSCYCLSKSLSFLYRRLLKIILQITYQHSIGSHHAI